MTRTMMGVLAALALGLLLTGGVALASFVGCTGGDCFGTQFADTMSGLNSETTPDRIFGLGSTDFISAKAGDDYAHGGADRDQVFGDAGNDTLMGGSGADFVAGDRGRDTIKGGTGNDSILATESAVFGPPEADVVDCGEDADGRDVDTAQVDRLDTVRNCEKVFVSRS